MSAAKETREFVKAIEAVGYEVRDGGKHLKVYLDDRLVFTLPKTPSDRGRWRKNKISEMRGRGLPLPERVKW